MWIDHKEHKRTISPKKLERTGIKPNKVKTDKGGLYLGVDIERLLKKKKKDLYISKLFKKITVGVYETYLHCNSMTKY